MVVDVQRRVRPGDLGTLDKAPWVAIVTLELVGCGQLERVARQRTDFFVATAEVRCLWSREQVSEEMCAGLVVVTEFTRERPVTPRMDIRDRSRVGLTEGARMDRAFAGAVSHF